MQHSKKLALATGAIGLYLDTNIYWDWSENVHLNLLRAIHRTRTPLFLTPSTVLEGLEDYWACHIDDLSHHRQQLRLMMQCGAQRILPPSGTALLHSVVGLIATPAISHLECTSQNDALRHQSQSARSK
jgi:hypothetical protein